MLNHSRRTYRLLFNPQAWRIRLTLWAGAIVLGLVSIVLIRGSEILDQLFLDFTQQYPYAPIFITPTSFIIIVWLIHKYFPGSQGGGVPQTIASLQHVTPDHLVSLRILVGKTILVLAALAAGASIGIGGPMVHIGASIMYVASLSARYTPTHIKHTAIMAGSAAAIAAIFSAPLAGFAFAMEEISRSFQPRRSGLIIVTVLLAMLVLAGIIDIHPYLGTLDYLHPETQPIWLAALVCGIAGGILGGLFSQAIVSLTSSTMAFVKRHPYMFAGGCGLIVAILGVLSATPIYGTGFHVATEIAQHPEQFNDPFFPFAKMIATAAAFLSGIPSGIFGPTIAIGASIGADLSQWFSFIPAQSAVLLGMTAYFSAVFQTPVTAAILVLEISGSLDILLPILAASFIAFALSRLLCPQPLYRVLSGHFINIFNNSDSKKA